MKRLILITLITATSVANAAKILINVNNPSGEKSKNVPITMGIPFARNTFKAGTPLCLLNYNGKRIPAQVKITNKWPGTNYVRWALLDFQLDLTGSKTQQFTILTHKGNNVEINEQLTITTAEDHWLINTGTAIFKVNKNNFNLFDYVQINNKKVFTGGTESGLFLKDSSGKVFRAAYGKPDAVILELTGSKRSVIRAEGWYFAKDGSKMCRYITRINFFANKNYVKIINTFIITEDTPKAKFSDIGINLPFKTHQVQLGGSRNMTRLKNKQSRYLLQYDSDKFLLANGANPAPWSAKGSGKRADGWIKADSTNGTLIMQIKDFWQNFPNEFEAIGNQAVIYHFWPKHGVAKPNRQIKPEDMQYLWFCHEGKNLDFTVDKQTLAIVKDTPKNYRYFTGAANETPLGVAKSTELYLGFDVPNTPKITKLWQRYPDALPNPKWMTASGIFGVIHPQDKQQFPEIERTLEKLFDWERRAQIKTRDYGKFNYGDGHTAWDLRGYWSSGYRIWRGYHHSTGRTPWLMYVRSGERKYLEQGIRSARHLMDLDICNYSTLESENRKPWYPRAKIKGALNDYKGLTHWNSGGRLFDYNCMTDFMLNYYFITGDKRGMDVAKMWGEAVKKRFRVPLRGRNGAGVCSSLIDLYLATGDEAYKKLAFKYVDTISSYQNLSGKMFFDRHVCLYAPLKYGPVPVGAMVGGWENYAPWAEKYYDMTQDPKFAQKMVKWADAFRAGYGDTAELWQVCDFLNVMAMAYFATKNPAYLSTGKWSLKRFILNQLHANEIKKNSGEFKGVNGTVRKRADFYDGFTPVGQTSLNYSMRNQIMFFQAALADYKGMVTPMPPDGMPFIKLPFLLTPDPNKKDKLLQQYEILIANPTGKPITINGLVSQSGKDVPGTIILFDPDGKKIVSKSLKTAFFHDYKIIVPGGPKGVYRLRINYFRYASVNVSPQLKWVVKIYSMHQRFGGTRLYFPVTKANQQIEFSITGKVTNSSYFYLLDASGKVVKEIFYTPIKTPGTLKATLKLQVNDTRGMWCLAGKSAKNVVIKINIDGKAQQWLATTPDNYFNVDKYKIATPSTDTQSAIKSAIIKFINRKPARSPRKNIKIPTPPGIIIKRIGSDLNRITMYTGKGALEMYKRIWCNSCAYTAQGTKINLTDPFLYNMRDKTYNKYLTDPKFWEKLQVSSVNNDKTLLLQASLPNSGMTKQVAISIPDKANIAYITNKITAAKKNHLSSDSQCIYKSPRQNFQVSIDGKVSTLSKANVKSFNWIAMYDKKNKTTVGLIILERSKTANCYARITAKAIDIQWGRRKVVYNAGESRKLHYILIWGAGNLTSKTAKIAVTAAAGKCNNNFYKFE